MRIPAMAAIAIGLCATAAPASAQDGAQDETQNAAPGATGSGQADASVNAPPVDPDALALANEVLTTAFPPDKRAQVFSSFMDTVVAQAHKNMESLGRSDDKEFQALLDRSSQRMFDAMRQAIDDATPDYYEAMAHAYARLFSQDDLKAILAFVKTPAGRHYFTRSTEILKDPDVQAASQRMTKQLLAKLPEIQRQTMQDAQEYVEKKARQQQQQQTIEPGHIS